MFELDQSFHKMEAFISAGEEVKKMKIRMETVQTDVDDFIEKYPDFKPFFKDILSENITHKALEDYSELLTFSQKILKELLVLKHKDQIKRKADCMELIDLLKNVN